VDKIEYFNQDNKTEYFYPLINDLIIKQLSIIFLVAIYNFLSQYLNYQIFNNSIQNLPIIIQFLLALFILDFAIYCKHRFVHKYIWSFHAVHHSAQKISWITGLKFHPLDSFVMGCIDFIILYFLGFSGEVFLYAMVIKSYYNIFCHTNMCLDFPKPFKYIFGSPNFHRWHHATDPEAYNKNFSVIFSCIDYVMGTYYLPDNKLPLKYGSCIKALDDIDNKTIWSELWYPIGRQLKKLKKFINKNHTIKKHSPLDNSNVFHKIDEDENITQDGL
jgi:lathosterol oxidase